MNEWISVKERLPKRFVDVLVYLERGNIEIRQMQDEEYPDCIEPSERYVWSDQGIINDVTHWMPLPEVPK